MYSRYKKKVFVLRRLIYNFRVFVFYVTVGYDQTSINYGYYVITNDVIFQ